MHKIFLSIGALLGGIAVALGAFGAHGLKKIVPPETVNTFQTGVQYQMYHALALLFLGLMADRLGNHRLDYAGLLFIGGIVFFSGSLYLISSLKAMNKAVPAMVGIMTPLGGLLFIVGWILLAWALFRR